jgi:hypothetical protein
MKQSQRNQQPSHSVYVVEGEGESAFWTKIGSAWPHKSGDGFNVQMSAAPIGGRMVIYKNTPKQDSQPQGGRGR